MSLGSLIREGRQFETEEYVGSCIDYRSEVAITKLEREVKIYKWRAFVEVVGGLWRTRLYQQNLGLGLGYEAETWYIGVKYEGLRGDIVGFLKCGLLGVVYRITSVFTRD